ncbi:MFS transporter [Pseudonocardia spinosispora]|uniref:MFS transporter n=1 Tax=Pseudonocardia spinosispora TaxID=103441 RepID=UPI0003FC4B1E|nr:MFS transporter [Pseudonocardia spinosispora]
MSARRSGYWKPVAAAMFCCGWGGNQFTPLLIMYRQHGLSALAVDSLLGAYVFGLVPGLLMAGGLSDRYGRRPVMIAGTVLSLVASVFLAMGEWGSTWIALGRFLTGIAVAVAMAVGSTWIKELSDLDESGADSGARRATLWLTLGFGVGPGVAGVLAQWGPRPMEVPYLVHVLVALVVVPVLVLGTRAAPTTVPTGAEAGSRFGGARHPRFLRVVIPMAPWIFGSAGVAYAIMPQLVGERLGSWGLPYSTLVTVCTLGAGVLIQPVAGWLDRETSARAVVVSMIVMSMGLAVSAIAATIGSPLVALGAAIVLGAAYGIAVVSGLLELQRMSRPDELAGLTGIYYALAYVGFLVPSVLQLLNAVASYPVLLSGLAVIALLGTAVIARHSRAHLPVTASSAF